MPSMRLLLYPLWATAVLAAPYNTYDHHDPSPTVKIKNGTVEGVHSSQYNQDYFLGIPYAQSPTGNLRFRVPQPLNTTWRAPFSAKQYSPACIGYGSDQWPLAISEDCLYLNVVRPSGYEGEQLPVAFWLHGGGLYQGSGIDPRYNLSAFVQRSVDIGKPIIGVSINYRLSMWGFINGDEVVESGNANNGLKDQRLALHWVQENIHAFGGDPAKVTLWGESAGALSVGLHLTAYGGRDDKLFRSAIMQSGGPIHYRTLAWDPTILLNASNSFGCSNTESDLSSTPILDCLRKVDTWTLSSWINSTVPKWTWNPIIDNDFIQGKTSLQIESGAFVHVPIISGANSDEGTAFGPRPMNSSEHLQIYLTNTSSPVKLTPSQATRILDTYPANITYGAVPTNRPLSWIPPPKYGPAVRRSDAYFGDLFFVAHRRKICQTWTANSLPVYCYRFNTVPHGISLDIGATHFQEVAFVFNNQAGLGYGYKNVSENPFEGMPEGYFQLAETMSAAWIEFISEGVPVLPDGRGEWPAYGEGEGGLEGGIGSNWVFDANVTGLGHAERDDFRKDGIELINSWNADVYLR
ncbi:Alpha/Beta hydrolase protein [Dendryphion nanum]|uniref:Carboxylic ester hydrolase n=1 Tax=Dendryphion nanum TaxID=256645 RepID=A0A9P9D0V2_9PLEO|nr:Alpha/Beta hydrolase protein [Dendryphion nanum]